MYTCRVFLWKCHQLKKARTIDFVSLRKKLEAQDEHLGIEDSSSDGQRQYIDQIAVILSCNYLETVSFFCTASDTAITYVPPGFFAPQLKFGLVLITLKPATSEVIAYKTTAPFGVPILTPGTP